MARQQRQSVLPALRPLVHVIIGSQQEGSRPRAIIGYVVGRREGSDDLFEPAAF